MKTEVIWTALPNGVEAGKLKLSVFVSHRLHGTDGTLESGGFTDASTWPSKAFTFKVLFPGQFGDKPAGDATATSTLQPQLWAAMMKGDTPVKAYQDRLYAATEIQTLSAAHVAAMVETVYQAALELHPTEHLPAKTWLDRNAGALSPLHARGPASTVTPSKAKPKAGGAVVATGEDQTAQIRKGYDAKLNAWRAGGAAPILDADGFGLVSYEAMKFHEPWTTEALKIVPKPDIDYHQALSALGNYPELLRAFGFVFDLEMAVPAGLAATGLVEIVPSYSPKDATTTDRAMKTAYQFSAGSGLFAASPQPASGVGGGMLSLGNGGYFVTEIDVDGAALKLGNATSPQTVVLRPAETATTTLPSLRSAGLGLHQADRAATLRSRFARTDKLQGDSSELHLDDVIRGYRIDIFDRGEWRSLCERTGRYSIGGQSVSAAIEGWITTAMSSAPGDTGAGPKKLHECMARWTGWSLAMPRPGKHLDEQGNLVDEPVDTLEHFKLEVQLGPPKGSLPPLRFGREYKMRARTVDLAGNGPAKSATSSAAQESESVVYARFDPVLAPAMYPAANPGFGESENHIVIRKFKSGGAVASTRRIVVPPVGGESLCEQHGKFDLPDGTMDRDAYAKIIAPHDGAQPLGAVVPGPLQDMPYLVDPMVRGALIGYTAPEPPDAKPQPEYVSVAFPGSWPKIGSITLTVAPVTGMAHVQPSTGTAAIQVPLRPGEIVDADISSTTVEDLFPHLGLANWKPVLDHPVLKPMASKYAAIALKPEEAARLATPSWRQPSLVAAHKASIVEGKVWLVTPRRRFRLVYATQVPEQPAALDPSPPIVHRVPGGTSLGYGYELAMATSGATSHETTLRTHAWSTDEVEAWATWSDDTDLIEEPIRKTEKQDRHGTAFKVLIDRGDFAKPLREKHELGDTKHHELTYVLRAHTRFRKYFDPKWAASEFLLESAPITFHAPSTARPANLALEYAIPTFGWSSSGGGAGGKLRIARSSGAGGDSVQSTRSGNGLRIYIARPWFSSGNGEKLAVVLQSTPVSPTDPVYKFVSVFGADPVFAGGDVPRIAAAEHFRGSVAVGPVQIPDVPGATVSLATYPVQFDDDRQLWFVDMQIDVGSTAYTPFVKLALARYQEHSLLGLELSHVATAEFMQLEPDRVATVAWAQDGKSFRASVAGVTPSPVAQPGRQGRLVVGTVEEKIGNDPDAAWRPTSVDSKELEGPVPFVGRGLELGVAGQFTLPTERTAKTYRLVIREYEVLPSDFRDEEAAPMMTMAVQAIMGRRLVYMDVLPLS